MTDFAALREDMVQRQIAGRGIADPCVLAAMRDVPRESFVPAASAPLAYDDSPLPIGFGQTSSQPYIVALMIAAARISPGDRVLEVGAGSGYAAAVIGRIAKQVFAIERHAALAGQARQRMEKLGYANVAILNGDGSAGLPGEAPFDAILAAASGPFVPPALMDQLVIGGRLVMPIGASQATQSLIRIVRCAEEEHEREVLGMVRFVPLIGKQGWDESGERPHGAWPAGR